MKKIGLVATAALVVTAGCIARERMKHDNGRRLEQTREVAAYTAISTMGGIDVEFSNEMKSGQIIVVAEEKVQDRIVTEVVGDELRISMRPSQRIWATPSNMKVIVPNTGAITRITASGGSDILAGNVILRGPKLTLNCSGGSDFKGNIIVDELDADFSGGADFDGEVTATTCRLNGSGGADLTLAGSAKKCEAEVSGGSDLHAARFKVETYDVKASGGSDAKVFCTAHLTASASGGSDIQYAGDCQTTISDDISSSVKRKH